MLVAVVALASWIARDRGVPRQILRLRCGPGIKLDLARDPAGPEQRDWGLLLLTRDGRDVHARAQPGNRSRAGAVDALHRVVDRSGRHGVRRTAPHARHRLRSQSRSQYALIPNSHEGFAISRMCVWRRTSCAVLWRRRLAGVVALCSRLKKPPPGRRRHEKSTFRDRIAGISFVCTKKRRPGSLRPWAFQKT